MWLSMLRMVSAVGRSWLLSTSPSNSSGLTPSSSVTAAASAFSVVDGAGPADFAVAVAVGAGASDCFPASAMTGLTASTPFWGTAMFAAASGDVIVDRVK
jgi:hypothetical protein